MSGITLDHLVGWLKASIGNLSNRDLLMVSLLIGNDWSIGHQGKMDSGVGHQVGLELSQINVEGSVKPRGKRCGL